MGNHALEGLPKPYTDTHSLQISEIDTDKLLGGFHEMFAAGRDEVEGVSGQKTIDTSYENWGDSTVERPASLASEADPPPVDTDRPKYPHREL